VSLIYATILMVAMCAFASFAVDLGRVQVAKTELQRAADAAARYGVTGLSVSGYQARTNAKAAAAENLSDGTSVVLQDSDVEYGKWNSNTNSFHATSINASGNNAIRVTARRTAARSNAIPLMFGAALGVKQIDVKATATAYYTPRIDIDMDVPASSNLWLAGMPNGTLANPTPTESGVRRDKAGPYTDANGVYHPSGESPALVSGISLVPGNTISFDSIAGTATNGNGLTIVGPDGNLNQIVSNDAGAEHGKSNLTAPINAVIGVFLDDDIPAGATPPNLDFSTSASRDFTTLSPELRQPFFIGDGVTSNGTAQQFTIPAGATRLYIGKMDGYEWNNNIGSQTITIHRSPTITLVK
jgi:Flp pilus assembly protein TadG